MSITLVTRSFTCNCCNEDHKQINAIADNKQLFLEFPEERIEDPDPQALYTYDSVRDEDGVLLYREAKRVRCPKCTTTNITPHERQKWDNVLNFFGPASVEKWYRGFNELGKN